MSDGVKIFLGLAAMVVIPAAIVFLVLMIGRCRRKRKIETYKGRTEGKILRITKRGADAPFVISVGYCVNGVSYEIRETAKLKLRVIKIGRIPVGQKKTFVLGAVKEGDFVQIYYDERSPQKAIIYGNEGSVTG